jgi:hypothetical protein
MLPDSFLMISTKISASHSHSPFLGMSLGIYEMVAADNRADGNIGQGHIMIKVD